MIPVMNNDETDCLRSELSHVKTTKPYTAEKSAAFKCARTGEDSPFIAAHLLESIFFWERSITPVQDDPTLPHPF